MIARKITLLLFITILITACSNNALTQAVPVSATPTQPVISTIELPQPKQTQVNIPQTEADVPRVNVRDAKTAFDSGHAVIVDVRSTGAFQKGHITGALFIPLGEIESNPTGVKLDKNQWIITYCT
jgi:3-mercaptopyruvate sulfurtransferase SseA